MIEIKRNPNGDSRTGNLNVTKDDFHEANLMHIADVNRITEFLANKLLEGAKRHDYTKLIYEDLFYKNYREALLKKQDFCDNDFYKLHISTERHHPNESLKEDFNLLDLLEMISDVMAASLARTGKMPDEVNLKEGILKLAFKNTVKLVKENLELKD